MLMYVIHKLVLKQNVQIFIFILRAVFKCLKHFSFLVILIP